VEHVHDVLFVLIGLEPVTDHGNVLIDNPLFFQGVNHGHVKGRRSLQVDVVFQGFLYHMAEMGTFRTVTVFIGTPVVMLQDGGLEQYLCLLDLFTDDGQVGKPQRGSVSLDHFHEVEVMEIQLVVDDIKSILGKPHA